MDLLRIRSLINQMKHTWTYTVYNVLELMDSTLQKSTRTERSVDTRNYSTRVIGREDKSDSEHADICTYIIRSISGTNDVESRVTSCPLDIG